VNVFDLVGINTAGVYGQGNYVPATPIVTVGGMMAVPEPAVLPLIMVGLAAAALVRRLRTTGVTCFGYARPGCTQNFRPRHASSILLKV